MAITHSVVVSQVDGEAQRPASEHIGGREGVQDGRLLLGLDCDAKQRGREVLDVVVVVHGVPG